VRKDEQSLRHDAHHEAGHCVVAWHYGRHDRIERVIIVEEGWSRAGADFGDDDPGLRILLAGDVAELRAMLPPDPTAEPMFRPNAQFEEQFAEVKRTAANYDPQRDEQNDIERVRRCLLGDEPLEADLSDDARERLGRLFDESRKLVEDHWSVVEALAGRLYEKRALTGDEVRELLGPRDGVVPG
jgi:hypothetical protein